MPHTHTHTTKAVIEKRQVIQSGGRGFTLELIRTKTTNTKQGRLNNPMKL